MNTVQANTIVAVVVSEENRQAFLPKYFKQYFLEGEGLVFDTMSEYSKDYSGGYWEFKELSNGSFYLVPPAQEYFVSNANNYSSETLSADAAGIFVTTMVLNRFMFDAGLREEELEHFIKMFEGLNAFINQHQEQSQLKCLLD